MFERFAREFPSELSSNRSVDAEKLAAFAEHVLGVPIPNEVRLFWQQFGSGYFGERILYFFGDGRLTSPRDSFQDWNTKDFWRNVYPPASEGGPVFFAETCFGDQLGFLYAGGSPTYLLFVVDTFEAFSIANGGEELFGQVLCHRMALVDAERYQATLDRLGTIKDGMHFAPLVSPLAGGSGSEENMCLETANVHFRTAIANFRAISRLAEETDNAV